MIPNKKEQKLREFFIQANLQDYVKVLETIFEEIELEGCRISARYDTLESNHSYEIDGCRIQISLQKNYKNPSEVIWTILHEFGHHYSGRAETLTLTRDQKLFRENQAWDIAQDMVKKHPELVAKIDDFVRFKNECLQTYIDNF